VIAGGRLLRGLGSEVMVQFRGQHALGQLFLELACQPGFSHR